VRWLLTVSVANMLVVAAAASAPPDAASQAPGRLLAQASSTPTATSLPCVTATPTLRPGVTPTPRSIPTPAVVPGSYMVALNRDPEIDAATLANDVAAQYGIAVEAVFDVIYYFGTTMSPEQAEMVAQDPRVRGVQVDVYSVPLPDLSAPPPVCQAPAPRVRRGVLQTPTLTTPGPFPRGTPTSVRRAR
jgi:hypothetical protein